MFYCNALISGRAFLSYNNHSIDLVLTVETYHRVTVVKLVRLSSLFAYQVCSTPPDPIAAPPLYQLLTCKTCGHFYYVVPALRELGRFPYERL